MNEELSILELIELVQKEGYFVTKVSQKKSGESFRLDMKRWSGKKYRFAVVSDTHLGSRYQQLSALKQFYSIVARRKIETVFHCGDLVDGERMYRGHEYEIFVHGADAQAEYAVKNYPRRKGVTTYVISGNHDHSFLKRAGFNLVAGVCEKRDDMEYLGDSLAFVIEGEMKIALMHGTGGVAYARSYKSQKIVEQLASENKPNMLFLGHYHVQNHMVGYRNVETVQMPCFQAQTPYLVAKGLYPFIAGLVVTVQPDKSGIASITYEWIPFYRVVQDDF